MEDSIEILKKAFKEKDPTNEYTKFYGFGGWRQSKRKTEFVEIARKIAEERGIPGYQREREEEIGVPLGQRYLEAYNITGTDVFCEHDDLHQINNAAVQQLSDDIRRTAIMSLDMAHMTLQHRIGVSVAPETINHYLEVANHAICGGAVAQEHMAEIHPYMVKDAYVKILTGDDELASHIDGRFLIDINKEYREEMAEKLKKGVGKHVYQVGRVPTIAVRIADGGIVHRWNANQSALAMVSAYGLGAGSVLGDISLSAKHMQYILLGTPTWPRRGPKGPGEPGGMPYSYMGDFCQTDAISEDPIEYCLETVAVGGMHIGLTWVGGAVIGGIAGVSVCSLYTNGILDDFVYHIADWIKDRYGGFARAKPSFDVIKEVTHKLCFYVLEQYNRYPLLLEHHWGGAIRFLVLQTAAGLLTGLATGNSLAAFLSLHYTQAYVAKEAWGRSGFGSGDSVDHINITNAVSLRPDEGLVPELRGPNVSSDSTSGLTMDVETSVSVAPHAARGDAWVLSPVVKVAFGDPSLSFDFKHPRKELARGALREFVPEGDRDIIKPPR
ncbi:MAG: coenzyme-B sulfoethylthiotransferase subunit alpha [Candidatus Syntropharchaeia archaeon]